MVAIMAPRAKKGLLLWLGAGIGAGPGFPGVFRVENFKLRVSGRVYFWLQVPGTRTKTRNFYI